MQADWIVPLIFLMLKLIVGVVPLPMKGVCLFVFIDFYLVFIYLRIKLRSTKGLRIKPKVGGL